MMRSSRVALVLAGVFVAAAGVRGEVSSTVSAAERAMRDASDPAVVVFAHRCLHRTEPENSVAAIKASIAAGVHGVEIDVRRTSDGTYVIMHDATVNRTTSGTGKVAEMTLEQIRKLQLRHATVPTGERVPTFEEMLDAAKGKIMINVDPKGITIPDAVQFCRAKGVIDQVVFKQEWRKLTEADRAWVRKQSDVYFMPIVFSRKELAEARAAGKWPAIELVSRKGGDPDLIRPEVIADLKRDGTRAWVNLMEGGGIALGTGWSDDRAVVEPDATFKELLDAGVGVIQTDVPELAIQTLERQGHGLSAAAASTSAGRR
jgi:glycerophosphoryl diester phosphodiesterase